MSEYRVNLDIFAGPMDLLLYLVRKEEVDIYDIPIAKVTEQYLEYVELIKMFDLDLAGDFLVLAATLMEIKSIMLLPRPEIEEGEDGEVEDPRKELVRQLLEYKKFKDAANLLEDAAAERKQRFTRTNYILEKIKPTEEPELDLDQVSIWTLLEAFDTIMRSVGNLGDSYKHIHDDTPIDLYQIELLNQLQTDGPMSLQKIFEGRDNKLVMIGLFLGMLELIRNKLIWVEQPEADGAIYLKPLVTEPAEEAVHNAIYASPEAMERDAEQLLAQEQSVEEIGPVDAGSQVDEPGTADEAGSAVNNAEKSAIPIMEIPPQPQGSVQPEIAPISQQSDAKLQ
ncbi:MAG: segregation and condensation protein A [Planctomycetota bacterium]|jgi:segregation and condensation protein A